MSGSDIDIQTEERGTFYLFKISGAFCARNILEIRRQLENGIGLGHTKFAIDMSGVDMLDSTGLGLIVNFTKTLAKQEGELLIVNPSTGARNAFDVSNTRMHLQIRENIEDIDLLFD
jgi:serine/threonine-protein kinase RsbW